MKETRHLFISFDYDVFIRHV